MATLPGWATEDNGLLHVRGIDDGFLYVIDGVPVYERLDQLSGLGARTRRPIESINVHHRATFRAEFGYKAGGVIDVRSKSLASNWLGTATGRTRHRTTYSAGAAPRWADPAAGTLILYVAAAGQRSDRFLDPVHPRQLSQPRRCCWQRRRS